MPRVCCFCSHANPARAKFCNECGTPLHLKPCTACDAVNPRSAAACLKCGAALETVKYETLAPAMATDRIMADADDMLAALQRDFVLARAGVTSRNADEAPVAPADEPDRPPPDAGPVPLVVAAAESATMVPEPESAPIPVIGERRDDSPAENVDVWIDPDTASARAEGDGRPRRGRRAAVVLLALILFLTPAAFWTQRNPEQLSAWRERVADFFDRSGSAPAQPQAPAADAPSAPVVATDPSPSPATGEAPPADASGPAAVAEQQAPAADAGAAPATRADASAPEATPAAPTVTPRESRARARSAAKSRGTGRATGSRNQRQAARSPTTKGAAVPDRAAEPCTEAVAALGLCDPRGESGRP